jgi:hypothetical protein
MIVTRVILDGTHSLNMDWWWNALIQWTTSRRAMKCRSELQ